LTPVIINMRKSGFLLVFATLLASGTARAQNYEIGIGAGAAGYMGDLNMNKPLKFSGPAIGGFVKLNLDPFWSVGLHYNYGRIKGDNGDLKFYSPLHEASAMVDFNFVDFFAGGGEKRFTPYIYAGVGGVIFNPKRKVDDEVKYLRLYRTEDQYSPYKNYAFSIPYGAGVKFKVKSSLTLFGNLGYRTAYTDYLDDVSKTYRRITDGDPDRIFLANPSGDPDKIGTQRGDSKNRDTYMFTQLGISYTFLCKNCLIF
jgi:hypothetical protein